MADRQALVFWGGWEGHTPERSARVAKDLLEANGLSVALEHGTACLARLDLTAFHLIVPMITMSTIEKAEVDALCAAVRGGVGLAGLHGLMCDSFRTETEYQFMTGGQWVAHPGNIIDYRVDVAKPDDAIMRGVSSFAYRSEQYYMHVDPLIDVLATTTFTGEHCDWVKGAVMPVVWKKMYGKGRVFYSALGHTADEFAVPHMKTMFERGMLWAAR